MLLVVDADVHPPFPMTCPHYLTLLQKNGKSRPLSLLCCPLAWGLLAWKHPRLNLLSAPAMQLGRESPGYVSMCLSLFTAL